MLIKKTKGKRQKGKGNFFAVFFFLFSIFYSLNTNAQCAMCRASLESEGSKTKAEAVNDGIVFLMAVPYILVAVIAVVIYRMYRKKTQS